MFGQEFRGGLPFGNYPHHPPQENFDEEYMCYSFAVQVRKISRLTTLFCGEEHVLVDKGGYLH